MVFKTYTKIANIGAFAVFFAFALFINSNILLSQELIWAKKAGSIGIDKAQDIKVDRNGNSYITGNIYGNGVYFSIFGEGEPNETQLKAAYLEDVFVAKYDNAGAVVWAKAGTGMGRNYGEYIEIDNSGNSYVIGRFQSSITFGEGESNETTLTSQGGWEFSWQNSGQMVNYIG